MAKQANDLERVAGLLKSGRVTDAVHVASGINLRNPWRDRIRRAWSARTRPDFYLEMGQDPDELIRLGEESLRDLVRDYEAGTLFGRPRCKASCC